ncbi:Cytochrome P450 4V2 [Orchesella cincta]|uniref:Cytochrome P450 4V2 n=1 Tax=Orchesella cincta TaxID=48709 RepID=A0A1D2NCU4_ORCCI|nr:Cytochrome P450 4V2 [Orchesella cincta]
MGFVKPFVETLELVGWTREMVTKFGPVVRVWNFGRPNVLVSSSDLAIALKKLQKEGAVDDKSADVKDFAVAINGIGLVSLPPEVHTRHKKFWNPFFNWRNIESILPDMQEEGIKVVNQLEKYAGRDSISQCKVFNLPPYAIRATFNITCCTAFGKDFMDTMSDDTANAYIHDFHTVAVNLSRRAFRPWLNKDFIYYSTPEGRRTKRSAERGASLMKEAIEFRRNLRNCGSNGGNCIQGDYKCFLDRLLDMKEQGVLNEAQIVGELNVFVAGGYDTSAVVISLVMYHLAIHPDHQEKIVQELQEVLGPDFGSNNNYPLTWDIIKNFKHLDLLYPLVPVLPRRSTQDIKLEDGKMIPKGVDVFILTDIIHRDPKYFEEPNAFKPERHSGTPIPSFMPFSLGNRTCVGQTMGMVTVKIIVAHLLMRYVWETTETKEGFKTLFQTLQVPVSVNCKIRKRTM